ncbi:MAG TPA: hypothetical protein VF824_12240 [Thermoanaerobaculia bacterium]|jgi:hypothetical protein
MSDFTRREFVATSAVALAATRMQRVQRTQRSPSIAPPPALRPVRAYRGERLARRVTHEKLGHE